MAALDTGRRALPTVAPVVARRLIGAPRLRRAHTIASNARFDRAGIRFATATWTGWLIIAFGQKQTSRLLSDVCFTPKKSRTSTEGSVSAKCH